MDLLCPMMDSHDQEGPIPSKAQVKSYTGPVTRPRPPVQPDTFLAAIRHPRYHRHKFLWPVQVLRMAPRQGFYEVNVFGTNERHIVNGCRLESLQEVEDLLPNLSQLKRPRTKSNLLWEMSMRAFQKETDWKVRANTQVKLLRQSHVDPQSQAEAAGSFCDADSVPPIGMEVDIDDKNQEGDGDGDELQDDGQEFGEITQELKLEPKESSSRSDRNTLQVKISLAKLKWKRYNKDTSKFIQKTRSGSQFCRLCKVDPGRGRMSMAKHVIGNKHRKRLLHKNQCEAWIRRHLHKLHMLKHSPAAAPSPSATAVEGMTSDTVQPEEFQFLALDENGCNIQREEGCISSNEMQETLLEEAEEDVQVPGGSCENLQQRDIQVHEALHDLQQAINVLLPNSMMVTTELQSQSMTSSCDDDQDLRPVLGDAECSVGSEGSNTDEYMIDPTLVPLATLPTMKEVVTGSSVTCELQEQVPPPELHQCQVLVEHMTTTCTNNLNPNQPNVFHQNEDGDKLGIDQTRSGRAETAPPQRQRKLKKKKTRNKGTQTTHCWLLKKAEKARKVKPSAEITDTNQCIVTSTVPDSGRTTYFCKVCPATMICPLTVNGHLNGRPHKKMLKQKLHAENTEKASKLKKKEIAKPRKSKKKRKATQPASTDVKTQPSPAKYLAGPLDKTLDMKPFLSPSTSSSTVPLPRASVQKVQPHTIPVLKVPPATQVASSARAQRPCAPTTQVSPSPGLGASGTLSNRSRTGSTLALHSASDQPGVIPQLCYRPSRGRELFQPRPVSPNFWRPNHNHPPSVCLSPQPFGSQNQLFGPRQASWLRSSIAGVTSLSYRPVPGNLLTSYANLRAHFHGPRPLISVYAVDANLSVSRGPVATTISGAPRSFLCLSVVAGSAPTHITVTFVDQADRAGDFAELLVLNGPTP